MDRIKTECQSLKDLKAILNTAKTWNVKLLVIGGWAVNAYIGTYRYTDVVDFVSLILNRREELDLDFIAKEIVKNNLTEAIKSRIEETANDVKSGELEGLWMVHTGQRMSGKDRNEIRLRFLRQLAIRIRQLHGV